MKYLAIFILCCLLAACGKLPGTNTGNPDTQSDPNFGTTPDFPNPPARSPNRLIADLCGRIKDCRFIANTVDCEMNVVSASGFTDELKLNPPYSTMRELYSAYNGGTFQYNTGNLLSCENAISQLSCSGSLVSQAYSTVFPSDFSKLYLLLRESTSCQSLKL